MQTFPDGQTFTVTTAQPPAAITGLAPVSITATSAEFSWNPPPSDVVSVYVKWSDGLTQDTMQNSIQRTDLLPGSTYTISVQAVSGSGLSPAVTYTFTTPALAPAAAAVVGVVINGKAQAPQNNSAIPEFWVNDGGGTLSDAYAVTLKNIGGTEGHLAVMATAWMVGNQYQIGSAPNVVGADVVQSYIYPLTVALGPGPTGGGWSLTPIGAATADAGYVQPGAAVSVALPMQWYPFTWYKIGDGIGGIVQTNSSYAFILSLQAGVLDANGGFTPTGDVQLVQVVIPTSND
jgi:hypothetical protein